MLLAINIGNTITKFGFFEGEKLIHKVKIETDKDSKKIDFSPLDKEFEHQKDIVGKIDGLIIGSVVPDFTIPLTQYIKQKFSRDPVMISVDTRLPIKLPIRNPAEIGADLLANMVAVHQRYPKPSIVLDSGTATTFCLLSKDSVFAGCVIAPGLRMLAAALSSGAALLPEMKIIKPDFVVGRNTIECMQAGIYWGYVGSVKEILARMKSDYKDAFVVGTGGNIDVIAGEIPLIDEINTDLTLDGLRIIYEYNKRS